MTTKKKVLIGSGVIVVILIVLNLIGTYRLCGGKESGSCMDATFDFLMLFFPFLPLFLFSLITYRMTETIFQSWWKFARIATPVSMGLILIAPSYSHDWMFPIEKGSVAMMTTVLFIFLSIIIIIRAYKRAK